MKSKITLRERVSGILGRRPSVQIYNQMDLASLGMRGKFTVRHGRGGRTIQEFSIPNLIVNEGRNHILGVQFFGVTPITTWHLGLMDESGFVAVDATDLYDDIDQPGNGWAEFVDYTDRNNADSAVTRPEWGPDAAASQSISNTTLAVYDFTGTGSVQGLFVAGGTNAATKGDHTAGSAHILWAATEFASAVPVTSGDDLSVTYSVAW